MDLFTTLEESGYIFITTHQHNGTETVCLLADRLSRQQFIKAAGRPVFIGLVDKVDTNRVNVVAKIKGNLEVFDVVMYVTDEDLMLTLIELGAQITQEEETTYFNFVPKN